MSKQKLLNIAFDLFSKAHYNSVTLSEIAQKANIKKPSIYSHFESKESLFMEVFKNEESRVHEYISMFVKGNKDRDIETALRQFLMESIDYISENSPAGGFWSYLLFVTPYDLPESILKHIDGFKCFIKETIAEIIQKGNERNELINEDLDCLVYSYCCLLQGNIIMVLNSKTFHNEKVYESWEYFWAGARSKCQSKQ